MRGFIEIWVKGPDDEVERMNARFKRESFQEAYDRAKVERQWYESRGYTVRYNHSYHYDLRPRFHGDTER